MKKTLYSISILTICILFASCKKDETKPNANISVSIVCEGDFSKNNGTITTIDKNGNIAEDLFYDVNSRPLGDVIHSMTVIDNKAYIVVNNSQKIEVVDFNTFQSIATIQNVSYPCHVIAGIEGKAFVSNGNGFSDNYIYVIDTKQNVKIDSIAAENGPNAMLISNEKLFVANSGGYNQNNSVSIIDIHSLKIEKNITVSDIPLDLELDQNGNVIVYCQGFTQYNSDYSAIVSQSNSKIMAINPNNFEVSTLKEFDYQLGFSENLIASYNSTIYYVDNVNSGLYSLVNGESTKISEGSDFYGVSINPSNGDIWTCHSPFDQINFVKQHNSNGESIRKYETANYPSSVIF